MDPSEARRELIAQHEQLRAAAAEAEALARRLVADEPVEPQLDRCLEELRSVWTAHNLAEQAVLEPYLLSRDGLGPQRVARMREEHLEEHLVLTTFLAQPLADVAKGFADFREELLAHMEAEERTFLDPRVLAR